VGTSSVRKGDMGLTCNSSQDDATVKCWGLNGRGQLGYGDRTPRGLSRNGECLFFFFFLFFFFVILEPRVE